MHRHYKKIIFPATAALLFFFSNTALAANLEQSFTALAGHNGLDPRAQAFCLANAEGEVLSSQHLSAVIIPASVSKLYTFDFALAKLGKDFRYTTDFVLNGTTLYINGGGDPHFVSEHLQSVVQKIKNEQGVAITQFVFGPNVYFNWQMMPATIPSAYTGAGIRYQFKSAPLSLLMKQINDYSTNISSDVLLQKAGGLVAFAEYMHDTYGAGKESINFSTGSGLRGNYTTCELTLRVINHLETALKENGLAATDVLSMPQVDPGVLQKRLLGLKDTSSIIAKSGSVNYHQNLAGIVNTEQGPLYFAVFSTYPKLAMIEHAKRFVDAFTETIARAHRLASFDYLPVDNLLASVIIAKIRP